MRSESLRLIPLMIIFAIFTVLLYFLDGKGVLLFIGCIMGTLASIITIELTK